MTAKPAMTTKSGDAFPSIIPDIPFSVIPDVFNRESMVFSPDGGTRMKRQKKKILDSR